MKKTQPVAKEEATQRSTKTAWTSKLLVLKRYDPQNGIQCKVARIQSLLEIHRDDKTGKRRLQYKTQKSSSHLQIATLITIPYSAFNKSKVKRIQSRWLFSSAIKYYRRNPNPFGFG